MINLKNGNLKVNENLEIGSGFCFDDFKQTPYYKNHDSLRMVYLNEKQEIDGRNYMVGLFFRENSLYLISLVNCDIEIFAVEERKREQVHDDILKRYGIESGQRFCWGTVVSDYDVRGNVSSINIIYEKIENE